ncbi:MAG: hypothetical protein M1817_003924 [Caeruleum heppii]|nr:MAG: hypothetical protein M1817_003924 [Caeruleum heppii]
MISRKSPRPPTPYQSPYSSREPSPSTRVFSDCEADDEGTMSSSDYGSPQTLSLAIPPHTPYCPKRPTLAEILSNTAPPPWTLSAFMAYLSQNHCLETLEFTMDASRYRRHFDQMEPRGPTNVESCEYVKMLWRRLLDAYIIPDGPREVNLPSDVRDQLLSLPNSFSPPAPESLEPAVKIIYELMDESVLVPFLNSVQGFGNNASTTTLARSSEEDVQMHDSDDGNVRRRRSRRPRRTHSPSLTDFSSTHQSRSSRSTLASGFGRASRTSPHASRNSTGSGDSLTDDNGSPASANREPMTPPTTPPTSDLGAASPGTSPRSRNDGTWRKMTGKLGLSRRPESRTSSGRNRMSAAEEDVGGVL